MPQTFSIAGRFSGASVAVLSLLITGVTLSAQRQTAIVVQDAPLVLLPESGRSPLLIMEKGVTVQINGREGNWFNVTVEGSRWGSRTGYVETKYLQLRIAAPSSPPAAVAPTPAISAPAAPRQPRPVADVSLKNVHRIYIEPMPGDLDQYISAEITKELKGRVLVVLDKVNADAIMRGVGENKSGVGAAITGRYLGLHDNATASITLVDPDETVVLWASEAGDRSLMWGALARGGQRKVANRLVNNLKRALNEAK
jgi:hypothetical protein